MPTTERRADRGRHHATLLLRRLGEELRQARRSAGLSQVHLGAAVGISGATVSRIERGRSAGVSIATSATLFAVLGQRLSARAYPEGPPLRDVGHARLLGRLKARLPPTVKLRTEVPLRVEDDLRAWDGELRAGNETCKLEAETVLHDLQATDRRIALKMADDGVDRVILLVADTHHNRLVLREFASLLHERYPLGTRSVLSSLRHGRVPDSSGVVIL